MNKLKNDDEVIVIAGKDKGKRGSISKVAGDKVFVAGVNMVKRHTKPNPNAGQPGGIIEREAAIHISNVAIFNPEANTADRVGIRLDQDNKKQRYFKSNGQTID
ncbi:MAG: 50S ribosomal protein L24 [Gammaproteobacteria bacterium]|nr:50S ribosomal protein L24 [Gammaproteobacteria bacterium]|tara:strand:+ start:2185 stop:2496 length:312 start_codon:yes stop_codon:yes gene_type:complete